MIALLWLTLAARAEVIDRVLAVVEEQLVTASDVALDADLARIDVTPVPFWTVAHGDALHREVEAAVIRELAGDVAPYRPSDEQVGARLAAMRDRFAERAAWQAFLDARGLDEEALRGVVERRMVVEAYLLRNIAIPPADEVAFRAAIEALVEPAERRLRIREIPVP